MRFRNILISLSIRCSVYSHGQLCCIDVSSTRNSDFQRNNSAACLSFSVKSLVQFALLAGRIENVKNREAWGCSGRKPEMKRIRLTISYLSDVRARNTTKRDRSNGQLRADIRIRVISTSVHRTDSAERREQSVIWFLCIVLESGSKIFRYAYPGK